MREFVFSYSRHPVLWRVVGRVRAHLRYVALSRKSRAPVDRWFPLRIFRRGPPFLGPRIGLRSHINEKKKHKKRPPKMILCFQNNGPTKIFGKLAKIDTFRKFPYSFWCRRSSFFWLTASPGAPKTRSFHIISSPHCRPQGSPRKSPESLLFRSRSRLPTGWLPGDCRAALLWSSHLFSWSILLERPKVQNVCVSGHRLSSPDPGFWSDLIFGDCRRSKSILFQRI